MDRESDNNVVAVVVNNKNSIFLRITVLLNFSIYFKYKCA